jgi:uncharacterized protein (DUF1499 family)
MSPSQPQAQSPASARPSRVAKIAWYLALITLAGVVIGVLGAMTGVLPPLAGFLLFAAAMVLGSILTLIVGLVGLIVTRARSGRPPRIGRSSAWRAVAIGGVLLLTLAVLASRSGGVPPIHDITTDPGDPPRFGSSEGVAGRQGRNLDYPQGRPDSIALQKEAYPDLGPIRLDVPPNQAMDRAGRAAEALGWQIVGVDQADGRLEATDTSRLFRFVDDIVVRIRPAPGGSIVDVRSTSRVGESDLGANAARIRAFREHLARNG